MRSANGRRQRRSSAGRSRCVRWGRRRRRTRRSVRRSGRSPCEHVGWQVDRLTLVTLGQRDAAEFRRPADLLGLLAVILPALVALAPQHLVLLRDLGPPAGLITEV